MGNTMWVTKINFFESSFVLDNEEVLWASGFNFQAKLGLDNEDNQLTFVPTNIPSCKQVASTSERCVVVHQDGTLTQLQLSGPSLIPNLPQIKSIGCGKDHMIALGYSGDVWATGSNQYGQLCLGSNELHFSTWVQVPGHQWNHVECGLNFTIGMDVHNHLWACGENAPAGSLGVGHPSSVSIPRRVNFPEEIQVKKFRTGVTHSICIDDSNRMYSWGRNHSGQLGRPGPSGLSPTLLEHVPFVVDFDVGGEHVLFIDDQYRLWGFGSNAEGQLGLDQEQSAFSLPTRLVLDEIQTVCCGFSCSMCVDFDGQLWAFGRNFFGNLGLGHTNQVMTPQKNPTFPLNAIYNPNRKITVKSTSDHATQ